MLRLFCIAFCLTLALHDAPAYAAQPPGSGSNVNRATVVNPGPRPSGLVAVLDGNSDAQWKQAITNPSISGVAVQIHWADIEPSQGSEDWSKLDELFSLADSSHKWVQLLIFPGFFSPSWALSGVESDTFPIQYGPGKGTPTQLPMPWDATYLSRWLAFVKDVSARYGARASFRMIGAAGPTSVSVEFTLPESPADIKLWQKHGYTPTKYVGAWKTVYAAYASDFPNQYVSQSTGTCLGLNDKSKPDASERTSCKAKIVSALMSALGSRAAIQLSDLHAGPGPNGQTSQAEDQFVIGYIGQLVTGFQLRSAVINTPRIFGAAGDPPLAFTKSVQLGLAPNGAGQHVDYIEVYADDVVAPSMQSALAQAAALFKPQPPVRPHPLPKF